MRLPEVGLRYRYAKGSKRDKDRELKRHVIEVLNHRHPDFFEQWLGGPLRQHRSWSHVINNVIRFFCPRHVHTEPTFSNLRTFVATLPIRFSFKELSRRSHSFHIGVLTENFYSLTYKLWHKQIVGINRQNVFAM